MSIKKQGQKIPAFSLVVLKKKRNFDFVEVAFVRK